MHAPPSLQSSRRWRHAATLLAVALTACASPPSTTPQPVLPTPAGAQAAGVSLDELALQQGFARWVAGFVDSARAAGVDDATLHLAFDDAHYVPRAVDSDRKQPEFTRAVWDYVDAIVSPARVSHGQQRGDMAPASARPRGRRCVHASILAVRSCRVESAAPPRKFHRRGRCCAACSARASARA